MNIKILPMLLSLMMITSLTGCLKTKEYKDQVDVEKTPAEVQDGTEHDTPKDEVDPISLIDMSLKPNEIGEILILMYHGIGDQESTWQRTPENFRKDLEYMYQNGYRMVSLEDYAKGNITTEAGYTPIILTFDDGRRNNFDIISANNGEYKLNSNCAISILEEFKTKYPDFNVTATFFLNPKPFGQEEYIEYKLKWLIDNGYNIGNHTYSHNELGKLTGKDIQVEIGSLNKIISKNIPNYTIETLSLPVGSNPSKEYVKDTMEGEFEGIKYKNIAVVDVGWRPAYSPFDTCNDFTSLFRVTASEVNTENCGMYDYFKKFEEGKIEKFISDGNPDVVTIPKRHTEYINKDMVGYRILNIYE